MQCHLRPHDAAVQYHAGQQSADFCGARKQLDLTFVHGDLKDFHVEHMKALYAFRHENMLPFPDRGFNKEDYQPVATRAAFKSYFESFKKIQGLNLISPYDVEQVGKTELGDSLTNCYRNNRKTMTGGQTCCHQIPYIARIDGLVHAEPTEAIPGGNPNGHRLMVEVDGVMKIIAGFQIPFLRSKAQKYGGRTG